MRKRLTSLVPSILSAIVVLVRPLPLKWTRKIGELVGGVFYYLLPRRKKIALENLTIAFPDSTDSWRRDRLRAGFHGWGRIVFELVALVAGKGDEIEKSITIEGMEHLDAALAAGKGVLIAGGHVGNFPVLGYVLKQRGHPFNFIIRMPENETMALWLNGIITGLGLKLIPSSPRIECVRQTVKSLRAGELVLLQVDINAKRSTGIFVKFFDKWIPTFPGAAVFAQRTGAPLVPMFIVRDGPDRNKIVIQPPIFLPRIKNRDEQVYETIQQLSTILEDFIRQHPDEWWWLHRRFRKAAKERPPRPEKLPMDSE